MQGYKIALERTPHQFIEPVNVYTSQAEQVQLTAAIEKLLISGAVSKCKPTQGQFLSSVFLTPKSDGSFRFILNLKHFNEFVKKEHFKMEDLMC